jgi:dUTP pyrophosphatase
MQVKIKLLNDKAQLPKYAHGPQEDAGMDLCSTEHFYLLPGETKLVGTGLSLELPPGFEAQVRSRSGLAAKNSVFVLNSPGTVDPSYRGEVKVILHNAGKDAMEFSVGSRVAQMVIARYEMVDFDVTEQLSDTSRGENGGGSTGI